MAQKLELEERNLDLFSKRLVFLDASGNYRSLYEVEKWRIVTRGSINGGEDLMAANKFAVQVSYSIDGKGYKEYPDFFDADEIKIEEIEVAEARLIRLRVMKKVLSNSSTATVDEIVDVEMEGTALCKRLDKLSPIFEITSETKHLATGGLWSYVTSRTETSETFKPRVF
jgi:hypothetical protein